MPSLFIMLQRDRRIRDAIRDLRDDQRMAHIRQAIADRDRITVNAVIHGPSYKSGLSDSQHEAVKRLAAAADAVD